MLTGFEFSQICLPRQRLSALLGKVQYMAPEVVKKSYSIQADVHAYGVVLYCLLTGQLPFEGNTGRGHVLTYCCTLQLHCSYIAASFTGYTS